MNIILNDSTQYELSGAIYEDTMTRRGISTKVICIPFASSIDSVDTVMAIVNDPFRMKEIHYVDDNGVDRVLTEYTVLEQISMEKAFINGEEESSIYIAKLSKTTDIPTILGGLERELNTVNDKMKILYDSAASLADANHVISETVDTMRENLQNSICVLRDEITQISSTVDAWLNPKEEEAEFDLEEFKTLKIQESKDKLSDCLNNGYIMSSAHRGITAQYSITEKKQYYLAQMITLGEINPDYQISWNVRGDSATYDWTLDELKQLAMEIDSVVRPLILKQQNYEVAIMKASSKEALNDINIYYNI